MEIQLIGEFVIRRDGEALDLPKSRKTRALLTWLLLDLDVDATTALEWGLVDAIAS